MSNEAEKDIAAYLKHLDGIYEEAMYQYKVHAQAKEKPRFLYIAYKALKTRIDFLNGLQ